MKLTAAALALIAIAAFNPAANAANGSSVSNGDLVLGVYDPTGNELEVNLGTAASFEAAALTNQPLVFNLASDFTAAFGSDTNLSFGAIASGGTGGAGANGLLARELLVTVPDGGSVTATTSTTPSGDVSAFYNEFNSTTPTGINTTANFQSSSNTNGFYKELTGVNPSSFGLNSQLSPGGIVQPYTGVLDLYIVQTGANANSAPVDSELGTLTFNTATDTLTFNAVPEPSTYALMGLSGLALLWALKRRQSLI